MMDDMSKHADPLGKTASELHRFYVRVRTVDQWYEIMRECRAWFGGDWQCQGKIRRKLRSTNPPNTPLSVWFVVPDLRICTWIATKTSLEVTTRAPDTAGK